jgi:putative tricarboxylic transport membrane protein
MGCFICVHAVRLQIGTPGNPGAGFMPFGTGLLLLVLSLVGVFRKVAGEKTTERWAGPHFKRVISVIASLVAYALILTKVGFVLTTFCLMVFLFRITGYNKWLIIIIKALLSAGLTYFVFDKWLGCRLPKGILGF